VDEQIKRYYPKVLTYVRDTQDFITKIRSTTPLPEGTYLVTMDIVSLYTNIPNHEAIVAIAQHLRTDPEMASIGPYILKYLVGSGLTLTLTQLTLTRCNKIWVQ
jgi:hypothetical protein